MEPKKRFGIPNQSGAATAGDGEKVKQGSFAEWKLFDYIDERRRRCRPFFAKLDERGFNLGWIYRRRCFFSNPTVTAIHRRKHHADWIERLAVATPFITTKLQAPTREPLLPGFGNQPDNFQPVRRRVPQEHFVRS
jgi:hypothetical protein